MQRFIKSFQNDAAIQEAVDNKSLGKPYVALNDATGKIDWDSKEQGYDKQYFTVEALEDGTFTVKNYMEYSLNGGSWTGISSGSSVSLSNGDKVRFKGNGAGKNAFTGNTISCKVYGNAMSLVSGDSFTEATSIPASGLQSTLQNCSGLVDASNLVIPEVTTNVWSVAYMFYQDISLIKGPELFPKTLAQNSYYGMFYGCRKLNYVKCLATSGKTVLNSACGGWLTSVSSTGTFVKKAGVTWPTGANGIPDGWTVIEE